MRDWKRAAARTALVASSVGVALLAVTAGCGKAHTSVLAASPAPVLTLTAANITTAETAPAWPADSVIYTLYPAIFSAQGNFAGVTAQLPRLKALGVTDVWVMPVTPVGHPVASHPSYDSPYCVHDYYAVNPAYGTAADLKTLIASAHKLGLRVILDEVLNHTSWDNPLITQHPEFYVHSDGDAKNPASIKEAFTYPDVAQLNYANPGLRAYMTRMLRSWIDQYGVDGFRFDSADTPPGPNRLIPADFWQQLGRDLRRTKPNILLLEEGEAPDLARNPFSLDYAWRMYDPAGHGALTNAADGGDASGVETAWRSQVSDFPAGMQHLFVQSDWDTPRDINSFGGPAGAQAVAVFNFTNTGVPLVYSGMEIGNAAGGINPHAPINWAGGDPRFISFYKNLIALRRANPALMSGKMTWLPNTAPRQLLTYARTGGGTQFLVEINLSSALVQGTVDTTLGSGWQSVPLAGSLAQVSAPLTPQVSLPPKSFAVYRRFYREGTQAAAIKGRNMNTKLISSAAAMLALVPLQSHAQTAAASDNASSAAYAKGYGQGQNGGTGFGPFKVVVTGTGGTFVFTATEAEGNQGTPPPSTIDANGKSFGLYAQSADASTTITRPFTAPLAAKGDSFSLDFVGGYNDAGTSGVALTTASGPAGSFVFHSGGVGVLFNDKPTGIGFVSGASHLVYTLTSPTTYSLKVTGADAFSGTGTVSGPITGFQVQQTNSGASTPDHNAYFNNLQKGHS